MFNREQATIPSAFIYSLVRWTFNETPLCSIIISSATCLVILPWTPPPVCLRSRSFTKFTWPRQSQKNNKARLIIHLKKKKKKTAWFTNYSVCLKVLPGQTKKPYQPTRKKLKDDKFILQNITNFEGWRSYIL